MIRKKLGFTLVELLVVIIILGVLMTVAYPNVINVFNDIKKSSMTMQENTIRQRAQMYVADCYDVETKWSLVGCANVNVTADQGYVYLDDMITDKYMEPVSFNGQRCTGYIDYRLSDYLVCVKCGPQDNPIYTTNNIQCTFDHSDQSYVTLDYTGSGYHTFKVEGAASGTGVTLSTTTGPAGYYKIELWGASGSTADDTRSYGAYTSGVIKLKTNNTLYFYIGGAGGSGSTSYNGGRSSSGQVPGGGATDVRLIAGDWDSGASLASRIMVAAGGGGGINGRAGGGLVGWPNDTIEVSGGKQISAGIGTTSALNGAFGKGGAGCGGGSGYFGGAGAETCETGGAGGSSYISGHLGSIAIEGASLSTPKNGCVNSVTGQPNITTTCSTHYTNFKFDSTVMIDGNGYAWSTTKHSTRSQMPAREYGAFLPEGVGNVGNGFVRISYLGE